MFSGGSYSAAPYNDTGEIPASAAPSHGAIAVQAGAFTAALAVTDGNVSVSITAVPTFGVHVGVTAGTVVGTADDSLIFSGAPFSSSDQYSILGNAPSSVATISAQVGAFTASAGATTGNEDCDIFADIPAFTASMGAAALSSIATIAGRIPAYTASVAANVDPNHVGAGINVLIPSFNGTLNARTAGAAVGGDSKKIKRRKVKIDNQWLDLTDEEWADYLNKEEDAEPVAEEAAEAPKAPVTPPDTSGLLAPAELAPDAPLPFQALQIDHSQAIRFAQQLEHRNRVQQDDEDVLALVHGMPEEHEPGSMTYEDMEAIKQHMDAHTRNLADAMGERLQALHHVLSAPKKIVRDQKGKAVGVTVSPHDTDLESDMTPKDMEMLKQHMTANHDRLAETMGQHLQALHHVLSTPKKIVRDAKGKAVGVTLDTE